jgi:hypothetical protein
LLPEPGDDRHPAWYFSFRVKPRGHGTARRRRRPAARRSRRPRPR